MKIDNSEVLPFPNKRLPRDFSRAVSLLERPYKPITQHEFAELLDIAARANTDIVIWSGRLMTFGDFGGPGFGFALMPLNSKGIRYVKQQKGGVRC